MQRGGRSPKRRHCASVPQLAVSPAAATAPLPQVRRLKIQQRLKEGGVGVAESMEETYNKEYPSALPLLPPMVRGHGLPKTCWTTALPTSNSDTTRYKAIGPTRRSDLSAQALHLIYRHLCTGAQAQHTRHNTH
jgi:hypothetical protein